MYAASPVRPTTSGPHFAQQAGQISGVPNNPLDERQLTHNMEHGALLVWFDPERVDQSTVSEIEDWMSDRTDLGYQSRAGGNIYVSPYDGQMDAPIAIRMWGFALDCEEWDPTVGDSMLIDYYGTRGFAPERSLSPYPDGGLVYGTDGGSETPTEQGSDDASEGDTPSPTPEPTEG